jgi:hypothetical protein
MMRKVLVLVGVVLAVGGCGDDDDGDDAPPDAAKERGDAPAKPQPGWRTVRNPEAGFTLSVPRRWSARTKGPATLIRSDDRLVSATVAADRGADGREAPAERYARETIESLPGFEGSIETAGRRVRGSPYPNAVVEARGSVRTSRVPQRITIAAFRRPGRVTYTVLVFRNASVRPRFNDPVVNRVLSSLRAQPPA